MVFTDLKTTWASSFRWSSVNQKEGFILCRSMSHCLRWQWPQAERVSQVFSCRKVPNSQRKVAHSDVQIYRRRTKRQKIQVCPVLSDSILRFFVLDWADCQRALRTKRVVACLSRCKRFEDCFSQRFWQRRKHAVMRSSSFRIGWSFTSTPLHLRWTKYNAFMA